MPIPSIFRMSSIPSRNIAKMSAAGSGKTYDICKEALEEANSGRRVLITTYTNRGARSVKKEIQKQNDGVLHPLVIVKTWFAFLLSDLIKPYQRYLTQKIGGVNGYDFSQTYGHINYGNIGTKGRYITAGDNVRSNEASSLACLLNKLSDGKVISRLEEIYSTVYFDEIQDLAGDDISIICLLLNSSVGVVCCGDNKQATFSTHNTKKNRKRTGKNIWEFFKELEDSQSIEVEKKLVSRRFNNQICCFANTVFPIGDPISTEMNEVTEHDGVYLIETSDANFYQDTFSAQVLRYDRNTDTCGFQSVNFGACKGETFDRVLIFPNGPMIDFIMKSKLLTSPEKYYVAVTRPKYSIAICMNKLPESLNGYEEAFVNCKSKQIRTLKFIPTD